MLPRCRLLCCRKWSLSGKTISTASGQLCRIVMPTCYSPLKSIKYLVSRSTSTNYIEPIENLMVYVILCEPADIWKFLSDFWAVLRAGVCIFTQYDKTVVWLLKTIHHQYVQICTVRFSITYVQGHPWTNIRPYKAGRVGFGYVYIRPYNGGAVGAEYILIFIFSPIA